MRPQQVVTDTFADVIDEFRQVNRFLPQAHACKPLRNNLGIVPATEDKRYVLPDQLVGDWVSRLVVEVDVDDGDVEMIARRLTVRCIK